ncbi:MAG: GNAT family N-acetyltransferase [Alphaproteobacteria bacterium HGW-Alphaproteobacteria-4]|jgi:GNAT superfamily N-acetyltransferase|nr:MAG: GNAT family N-acetyltransferase [Alphaproteobacteria bacterium HGW-Alphaproteobacteria-4]
MPEVELTATPTEADLAAIGAGLSAFNAADAGPSGRLALAVVLRGDAGAVVGGLSGYTAWGWLYVQWLWLAEPLRGQGWAGRMLALAEAEAQARGCHGAWIDTFNPVALAAYQRAGYRVFGTLPEFPPGRSRVFLQKPL